MEDHDDFFDMDVDDAAEEVFEEADVDEAVMIARRREKVIADGLRLRFCTSAKSLLYPSVITQIDERTGQEKKTLVYSSKASNHVEKATSNIVYQHKLEHELFEDAIPTEVVDDPTLPRYFPPQKECEDPDCEGTEAVIYQPPILSREQAMKLIFICRGCGYKWSASEK
mmetsp:Transcript_26480/g.66629  ORF Transcript_26480/g.66629 Transcript_26480/m.66629 type:complete len:169 (+) Transcript_26480:141-647(+)